MFFQKITYANRKIICGINNILKPFGLNVGDWRVFLYLSKYQVATPSDICEYYDLDKAVLTRNISKLHALGMLDFAPSKDKRQKHIFLTLRGKEVYFDANILIRQYEENILLALDENGRENIVKLIDIINQSLTTSRKDNENGID